MRQPHYLSCWGASREAVGGESLYSWTPKMFQWMLPVHSQLPAHRWGKGLRPLQILKENIAAATTCRGCCLQTFSTAEKEGRAKQPTPKALVPLADPQFARYHFTYKAQRTHQWVWNHRLLCNFPTCELSCLSPPPRSCKTTQAGQEKSRTAVTQKFGMQCPCVEIVGSSALKSWA